MTQPAGSPAVEPTPDWASALRQRLEALRDGLVVPVAPRDAATVLLVRDGETGLEVFLVQRASTLAFAGGMFAFPGGAVEPGDGDWPGPLPAGWSEQLAGGDDPLARRVVGAAVRETHEECGVWLGRGGVPPAPRRGDPPLDLAAHPIDVTLLRPWAHWLTPEVETRRFDTRFLLAALPDGQQAAARGGEADSARWVRPGQAAELPMLPPTRACLDDLAAFGAVAEALAAPRVLSRIMPVLQLHGDGVRFLMPGDPDYPRP